MSEQAKAIGFASVDDNWANLRAELLKEHPKTPSVLGHVQSLCEKEAGIDRLVKAFTDGEACISKTAMLRAICALAEPSLSDPDSQKRFHLYKLVIATVNVSPRDHATRWMLWWLRLNSKDMYVGNTVRDRVAELVVEYKKPDAIAKHLTKLFAETGYEAARWDELLEAARKATPPGALQDQLVAIRQIVRDGLTAKPELSPPNVPADAVPVETLPAVAETVALTPAEPAKPAHASKAAKQKATPAASDPNTVAVDYGRVIADAIQNVVIKLGSDNLTNRVEALEQDKLLRTKLDEATAKCNELLAKKGEDEKKFRDAVELAAETRKSVERELADAKAEIARLQELEATATKRIESAVARADQNIHSAKLQLETAVSEFRRQLGNELQRYLMDIREADSDEVIPQNAAQAYIERLVLIRSILLDNEVRVD